jgi:3-methylfumaryl-CoA hydratase
VTSDPSTAATGPGSTHAETSVGRKRTDIDFAEPNRANGLRLLLDRHLPPLKEGDPLPPLWHWTYFWEQAAQSRLAEDGHALRGDFLPASDLAQRMWAGSEVVWQAPLRLGEIWHRESVIEAVTPKDGRSGRLLFVTVRHEIESGGRPCLTERQSIVYREATRPGTASPKPRPAPDEPLWQRRVMPDSRLLFRYSALTFNAHRIHYDAAYARRVEGYPALVVHGPLLATMMVDLVLRERPGAELQSFSFRAIAPVLSSRALRICGLPRDDSVRVWVETSGGMAMDGVMTMA